MKKYLSCVILIVLCIACAMIFYVNANDIFGGNATGGDSDSSISNDIGDTTVDTEVGTDSIQIATIGNEGTILGEYYTNTNLRIEYAIYKIENEKNLYLSCEMYLDSKSPITSESKGYLSINGVKKEFTLTKMVGESAFLTSVTSSIEFTEGKAIKIEGFLDVNINDNSGVSLSNLKASGTIVASEEYLIMPSSYLINMEHISQYPDLPSGDEVTSLAMVLNFLGYDVDKNELCDLYLDKGPVGYTSFYEANVGNPRNAYNSYGCLAPVIVKAGNRFTTVNGGAIYTEGTFKNEAYPGGMTFTGNKAQYGGAIFACGDVTVGSGMGGNSTFTNNQSTVGEGGAIYAINSPVKIFGISN